MSQINKEQRPATSFSATTFSAEEYAIRQQRTIEAARARGLDGVLVADPSNLYYLIGYNAWSFYTPQVLFLPVEGEPTFILRAMDANGAWRTAAGIDPADILGWPEYLVHQPDQHPGAWIAQALRDRGAASAERVGYEGDAHFFAVRTFLAIAAGLPEWKLEESQELVNWVRLVKSSAEIDAMRAAGQVCTSAMNAAIDAIDGGVPQNEVAAAILSAQTKGVDPFDGDYAAFVPILPTGAGADTPHLTWTADPLPVDEPISIELAGVYRRYHAPIARTVVIGRPSQELQRLAGATVDGLNAALDTARPGVTASDVAFAFDRIITKAGYSKESRLGYSIGIGFPPDWGERTVSIRKNDHTVLAENMTFHLIAGMWMTGFGIEVSESIRIAADGVELFTDIPRGLIVKPTGGHR